jgi:hypothetical protein
MPSQATWDTEAQLKVSELGQQYLGMPLIPVKDYGDDTERVSGLVVKVNFRPGGCDSVLAIESGPNSCFTNLSGAFLMFDEQHTTEPCSVANIATAAFRAGGAAALIVQSRENHNMQDHSNVRSNIILASVSISDAARLSSVLATNTDSKTCTIRAEEASAVTANIFINWPRSSWKASFQKTLYSNLITSARLAHKHASSSPLTIDNARVVVAIFFGRKPSVEILNVYIQRNLRRNGGMIDEVQFLVNTDKQPDLDYLSELLRDNPGDCQL